MIHNHTLMASVCHYILCSTGCGRIHHISHYLSPQTPHKPTGPLDPKSHNVLFLVYSIKCQAHWHKLWKSPKEVTLDEAECPKKKATLWMRLDLSRRM